MTFSDFVRAISKNVKMNLGLFIPNCPQSHTITNTKSNLKNLLKMFKNSHKITTSKTLRVHRLQKSSDNSNFGKLYPKIKLSEIFGVWTLQRLNILLAQFTNNLWFVFQNYEIFTFLVKVLVKQKLVYFFSLKQSDMLAFGKFREKNSKISFYQSRKCNLSKF